MTIHYAPLTRTVKEKSEIISNLPGGPPMSRVEGKTMTAICNYPQATAYYDAKVPPAGPGARSFETGTNESLKTTRALMEGVKNCPIDRRGKGELIEGVSAFAIGRRIDLLRYSWLGGAEAYFLPGVPREMEKMFSENVEDLEMELRITKKDGSSIWVRNKTKLIFAWIIKRIAGNGVIYVFHMYPNLMRSSCLWPNF